jgi:hypothetical protein
MFREKRLLRMSGNEFVRGYIFQYESILERKPTTYKVVGRRRGYVEIVKANVFEILAQRLMVKYKERRDRKTA